MRRRGINREGLAALLPVQDRRETALRNALDELEARPLSPFARIGSTHFARLVVVEEFPGPDGGPLADVPACLFFGAEFDITVAGYLEAVCALLPEDADAVFGQCAGYPGANVPPLFAEWMLGHRVRPGFSLQGNADATVREVVAALGLRDQIIEFALETRALEPAALRAAWDARNWGSAA